MARHAEVMPKLGSMTEYMSVLTDVYVRSCGEMEEMETIRRTDMIQTLPLHQYTMP